jgi:hypothetical protein
MWRFHGIGAAGITSAMEACDMATADGLLRGERFFFDLASLCTQIDLPVATLLDTIAPLRGGARATTRARMV